MTNTRTAVVGTLLALLPALGLAQDQFRAIDRNGDGSISSQEWYGQRTAPVPFTLVDVNGDGRISESEFREWTSARGGTGIVGITPADRFRVIDRNKDNVISADEWKNGMLALTPFEAVDRNRDGSISRREFMAWDQERGGTAAAAPAPPPGVAAPTVADRLRGVDQGAAGPAGPAGAQGPAGVPPTSPPTPSNVQPGPGSAITTVPGTSQVPGASSPNLGTGSSLYNR